MTEDIALAGPDDATTDMFGGAPVAAAKTPYLVLARKYRPQTFDDLIGQEAMVRTLTHAFERGRIAHAFMLTGVRGVGKTTTARLLARALNFESATQTTPSMDLSVEGIHCKAIIEGRHMDVLELDAASRTGVDDMRELLDGVRYAPVSARTKIYIIDEVHMLSKGAFNALLKTLEEPPAHAKFIFATTEIRKVPVTILSRCQRFDLRRVSAPDLAAHLGRICTREAVAVEADGLSLIARAAEGSVRDALSLLDQALVQAEGGETVSAAMVRDMLGLADRGQSITMLEHVLKGEAAAALRIFDGLYAAGADPSVVVHDLLDHAHAAALARTLGREALSGPSDQIAALSDLGAAAPASTLSRLWQMLLRAHDEVRQSPDPKAALDMVLIRLSHAADLPTPEDALKRLMSGEPVAGGPAPRGGPAPTRGGGGGTSAAMQTVHTPQAMAGPQAGLSTFAAVVALTKDKRDIRLAHDLEYYVRLDSFKPGAISFALTDGAPSDLSQRLSQRLKEWTGQTWLIATTTDGAETLAEVRQQAEAAAMADIKAHPLMAEIYSLYPRADIIRVTEAPAAPPPSDPDVEDDTPWI
jgi:DNA polymerase-3 subunit gamma/tau